MSLRRARPLEAGALTALCLRSKAIWGYDTIFMAACRDALTVRADAIAAGMVAVVDIDDDLAGVVELEPRLPLAALDKLFIAPDRIGGGIGRVLFGWARRRAIETGATGLSVDADPAAVGFYRNLGARDAGLVPSTTIAGRFIPRLVIDV